MKNVIKISFLALVVVLFTNCNIAGLDFQKDPTYKRSVIDPQTNMSVLDYIKSRPDLFSSMLEAINYTGLDTLYTQTGKTYLLLTNTALNYIITPSSGTYAANTNAYFYVNKVVLKDQNGVVVKKKTDGTDSLVFGSSWNQYDKTKVTEMLKYHVLRGTYNYGQLTSVPVWARSCATGDTCKVRFYLTNDRYCYFYIQTSTGSIPTAYTQLRPRTSGLECTNSGGVHVMDRVVYPPTKAQLNGN